jgi:DNA-directed RNA polymerase subunit RPC12/RpoP
MSYEEVKGPEWERTALYLACGMLLIVTAAIFLFAINRVIGAILWFILVGVVLTFLVRWHTKTYAYRCTQCGEQFEISPVTNFVSPQGVGKEGAWKYLKCPRCNKHEPAEVLKKVKR